jgi:hypothetical protein
MTDTTIDTAAQPEPVSSDTAGLRQLANELETQREMDRTINPDVRTAPVDVSSRYPNPTDADVDQIHAEKAEILKQRLQAISEERSKEGRSPIDAITAAKALADLRQDVGQAFDNEMQIQAAEVQADAQAQQEQPQRPEDSPEVAAVKQALSSEWQATNQAATQYRAGLQALGQMIVAQANQQFSDIKTDADVQRLAQTDPLRYLQFEKTKEGLGAVLTQIQNADHAHKQQIAAQFNVYAKEQDDKFMQMQPQLADEKMRTEAGRNTVAALKSAGLSEAEIQHAWNNHVFLRDARVQSLLLDLGNYYAAKQAARRATAVPRPPVQRPSGRMMTGGVDRSAIESAGRQFSDRPNVKNAAALLAASRRGSR